MKGFKISKVFTILSVILLCALIFFFVETDSTQYYQFAFRPYTNIQQEDRRGMNNKSIELTIRMPISKQMIRRFLCDLMRSSVVFWNQDYGDVVLILDEEDKPNHTFIKSLTSTLPFNFRIYYEKAPTNVNKFMELADRFHRSYGYYRMFYSSFLMDLYASPNSIIAWVDSDVTFTMPVIKQTIFRNGKLVVKGANTFRFSHVKDWAKTTSIALGGLPMIADFMTYFPAYVYPSTIKNCREYIYKVLAVNNMEDAMEKIAVKVMSPVCIILSYAYYFERHLYDWHIDLVNESLDTYNKKHSVPNSRLLLSDITPELHQSIHVRYYEAKFEPLKQALCYTFLHIGKHFLPECELFKGEPNWQLLEFQSQLTHVNHWCGGNNRVVCEDLIDSAYRVVKDLHDKNMMKLGIKYITLVEAFALASQQVMCSNLEI